MLTGTANEDPRLTSRRLSLWLRVREYAVPPSMIETATSRRCAGDWAGACAAAGVDVDVDLRSVAHRHGHDLAARVRDDLRHLAPDLLRWHLPRIAPDGLLRPGLTVTLARYDTAGRGSTGPDGTTPDGTEPDSRTPDATEPDGTGRNGAGRNGTGRDRAGPVHLVARTPPAWADAGQRISLALWDGSRSTDGDRRHPHPHPSRRFRLDLHRHLWDTRRTGELRIRSGADRTAVEGPPPGTGPGAVPRGDLPPGHRCAVDRWAAEAGLLIRAEGRAASAVTVRLEGRQRLLLRLDADGNGLGISPAPTGGAPGLPVLPDAAVWVPPDLELLRAGLIGPDRLHPLVAMALVPGHRPTGPLRSPDRPGEPRIVECRGARHRIGLVDGVLAPLDHDPAEIRREELLVALTGTPLPCLRAIDEAHRRPDCLTGVRERLDHGDTAGALAVVEGLLGPEALLRAGPLRDELEAAALRRIAYGMFRAGLADGRSHPPRSPRRDRRSRPRLAASC
ncbi:hypothetical protein [Streptomyces sp. CB01881]|uniref:hypothetical protein n=1 Tax=Streptomyces sp. CB01881 TaxID=2078691 RepID=UPI000CDC1D7A|nr:hypothetical protein [Streptomyces sp. CB01881]AUY53158.1 hypothetical protein C2142_34360 [Streptomyces sp. CB01881]TYC69315.1 hypothetical protein EH183_34435 [Streptomyces sp. CB01881]